MVSSLALLGAAPLVASPATAASIPTSIGVGAPLASGASLQAGRYSLTMQSDGNLVERWLTQVIWSSRTGGHPGATGVLQSDGNFVVYANHVALWSSGSGGHASRAWRLALLESGDALIGTATRFIWSSHTATTGVRVHVPTQPTFPGDAGDPTALVAGGVYYAFTTGTALGNNLQVVVSTSATSGYHSYTNHSYGSTALPNPPAWQHAGTETSPSVAYLNGAWRMFYDTYQAGQNIGTGWDCLSEASATSITSTNAAFTDTSTGPLTCMPQYGGVLDPSVFVDPTTNQAWLIYKTNDGGNYQGTGAQASHLFVQAINANGVGLYGSPTMIWTNDTVHFPWENTLDNPDLIEANGRWLVLFATGNWQSASYAEAYLTCTGPLGPCTQPDTTPFLSQANAGTAAAIGPGGGSLFDDPHSGWYLTFESWSKSCATYSCGAVRQLFITPFDPGV